MLIRNDASGVLQNLPRKIWRQEDLQHSEIVEALLGVWESILSERPGFSLWNWMSRCNVEVKHDDSQM